MMVDTIQKEIDRLSTAIRQEHRAAFQGLPKHAQLQGIATLAHIAGDDAVRDRALELQATWDARNA